MPNILIRRTEHWHGDHLHNTLDAVTPDARGKLFGRLYSVAYAGDSIIIEVVGTLTAAQERAIRDAVAAHVQPPLPPPEPTDKEEITTLRARVEALEGRP